jgi:hypothetical protein
VGSSDDGPGPALQLQTTSSSPREDISIPGPGLRRHESSRLRLPHRLRLHGNAPATSSPCQTIRTCFFQDLSTLSTCLVFSNWHGLIKYAHPRQSASHLELLGKGDETVTKLSFIHERGEDDLAGDEGIAVYGLHPRRRTESADLSLAVLVRSGTADHVTP